MPLIIKIFKPIANNLLMFKLVVIDYHKEGESKTISL